MRIPSRLPDSVRGPLRLLLAPAGPLAAWLERLAAVQAVDRGVALGALGFSALFPLLIVYSSLAPHLSAHGFAQSIVTRLNLSGAAAQSIDEMFAPSTAVAHSVTAIGVLLVVFSTLSLARALQRMYELCYELPAAGVRGTPWHLLWIALIPLYVSVRPLVAGLASGWWHVAGSLLLGTGAWLLTPYVLLGRRLPWRELLPGAGLAALGMTVLMAFSLVYLPHSLTVYAQRFGAIGIAFALLSWLVLAGFVLVGTAAAGAVARQMLRARGTAR
ncbi:MAG TPA: YhjD/YihY/BrkB family envelope integrity protein [Solirubrobacteraceae bacterium]|jgi:membrane protein|nr:YhjD/YihY/BrkB family envelope integrity protein [Solirubrobacteraceae bacterium]